MILFFIFFHLSGEQKMAFKINLPFYIKKKQVNWKTIFLYEGDISDRRYYDCSKSGLNGH